MHAMAPMWSVTSYHGGPKDQTKSPGFAASHLHLTAYSVSFSSILQLHVTCDYYISAALWSIFMLVWSSAGHCSRVSFFTLATGITGYKQQNWKVKWDNACEVFTSVWPSTCSMVALHSNRSALILSFPSWVYLLSSLSGLSWHLTFSRNKPFLLWVSKVQRSSGFNHGTVQTLNHKLLTLIRPTTASFLGWTIP